MARDELRALRASNAVITDRDTGRPLTARQLRARIKSGQLVILFARQSDGSIASDPNPKVVDRSEELLTWPIGEAYMKGMYPNGNPNPSTPTLNGNPNPSTLTLNPSLTLTCNGNRDPNSLTLPLTP